MNSPGIHSTDGSLGLWIRVGPRLRGLTAIGVYCTTELWPTAISNCGMAVYFCVKNGIWHNHDTKMVWQFPMTFCLVIVVYQVLNMPSRGGQSVYRVNTVWNVRKQRSKDWLGNGESGGINESHGEAF